METLKVEKVNLTENIADRIARWAQDPEADRLKYLKVKLGLETLLINVSKLLVVYIVVLFLGLFWHVLVFNISYYLIRRVAGGMHAPSNFICSLLSVITFAGIPYLAILYALPLWAIPVAFIFSGTLLYFFAPYVSKKNGDIFKANRFKLRNQALVTCFVLLGIALLVQNETFQTIIALGVTFASVLTIHNRR